MIPLYYKNDIFPKYIHFAFALLTAWLIFKNSKKCSGMHSELENSAGIRTAYFFRTRKHAIDDGIISAIAEMGHEIGYHY
jgi:hypothetical protein